MAEMSPVQWVTLHNISRGLLCDVGEIWFMHVEHTKCDCVPLYYVFLGYSFKKEVHG